MKKEFIINNTGRPSPLNDFREVTSPFYFYHLFLWVRLSEAVRPPLPITRAAKVSTFHEEKKREGVTVRQVPHATTFFKLPSYSLFS